VLPLVKRFFFRLKLSECRSLPKNLVILKFFLDFSRFDVKSMKKHDLDILSIQKSEGSQ
jgi:hypothetical protein